MTGRDVKALRKRLGFRRAEDLADEIGVHRVTVAKWEADMIVVPESMLSPGNSSPPPLRELYVIVNSRLAPDFDMPQRVIASVLGRAISVALTSALRAEVALIYVGAARHKIALHMAHVDPTFNFPMRGPFDGKYMQALFDVGVAAVIQPGGSKRDAEVIEACDAAGVPMVFTKRRHFRH